MPRTPHRKFARIFCPMTQCEKCGGQIALSEFRIICKYFVFDRDIFVAGKKAGNFGKDGSAVILAGKCECGFQTMHELQPVQIRDLMEAHMELLTKPEEDDILIEEVGGDIN